MMSTDINVFIYKCKHCGYRFPRPASEIRTIYDHEREIRDQITCCPRCLGSNNIDELISVRSLGRSNGKTIDEILANSLKARNVNRCFFDCSGRIAIYDSNGFDLSYQPDRTSFLTKYVHIPITKEQEEYGKHYIEKVLIGDKNMKEKVNKTEEKNNTITIRREDSYDRKTYKVGDCEPGDYIRRIDDQSAHILLVVDLNEIKLDKGVDIKKYVVCLDIQDASLLYLDKDDLCWWYNPNAIRFDFGEFKNDYIEGYRE